jgi:hypothetical protein
MTIFIEYSGNGEQGVAALVLFFGLFGNTHCECPSSIGQVM